MKIKDFIIKVWAFVAVAIVLFVIFSIFNFLFAKGFSEISLDFLLKNPEGMPLGTDGGIKNAIIGSFWLMLLSMLLSSFMGVCCAIYKVFYCSSRLLRTIINLSVQCISSIPSIIIGMFVYGFFIVKLDIGRSLFTAGIALAIMVFPFVEINIEKVISEIDNITIRDSYSLGIGKTYMCRKLIIPSIKKNIISISILAGSYAIGATAPLLLTGVVFMSKSDSLFKPVMALPFHLHMLLSQSVGVEKAYATAMVLVFILLLLHIVAEIVLLDIGGKISEYFRRK